MTERVVTELTIDARGATVGSAAYVRAMNAAQSAVDKVIDREQRLNDAMGRADPLMMGRASGINSVVRSYEKLRASIDPLAKAQIAASREMQQALLTTDNAVKRGVATQQEAAATIAALRQKQIRDLDAVRQAHLRTNQAGRAAANQNFATANIAAQFQDIAVTSAMGMSPLQIALQQGTQISAAFGQAGAAGAVAALRGAFVSLVNPVSLVTIGLVAAAAAAIQYGSKLLPEDVKSLDDAMQEHAKAIKEVADAYGIAGLKAEDFANKSRIAADAAARRSALELEQSLLRDARAVIPELLVAVGLGFGADVVRPEFAAFQDSIEELVQSIRDGRPEFDEFEQSIHDIVDHNPALQATGDKILGIVDAASQASSQLEKTADQLGRLHGFQPEKGDLGTLDRFNLERSAARERRNAEAWAELDRMRAKSPQQIHDAVKRQEELKIVEDEWAEERRDRIRIASTMAFAEAQLALVDAYKDRQRAIDEALSGQQLEIDLLGKTAGEAAALRFEYEQTLEVRRAAAEAGVEADQRELDLIKEKAAAMGEYADSLARLKLHQDVMFERDQLFRSAGDQQIASRLRSAGLPINLNSKEAQEMRFNQEFSEVRDGVRGFLGDISDALVNGGDDIGKALAQAILGGVNKLLDRLLDQLFDSIANDIAMMFMRGKSGGGILGGILGGGGESPVATGDFLGAILGISPSAATGRAPMSLSGIGSPGAAASLASGNSVQAQVWNFFAGKGLAPHQVAGIMGNVGAESAFNPSAIGDNGKAFGLFQHWSNRGGGRGMLGNTSRQLELAWNELQGPENRAFRALLGSRDVRGATAAFAGFERPRGFSWDNPEGAHNFAGRLKGASEALAKFGSSAVPATAGLGDVAKAGASATQGLGGFASALSQFPAAPGGGGGGGFGGLFKGLFGSGGGLPSFDFMNSISPLATSFILGGGVGLFHDGGIAGSASRIRLGVDPRMFIGAPRYHGGGIAGDEVPAILRRGEPVFRSMEHARQAVGGGGTKVTVNVINNAGMQVQTRENQNGDGTTSIDVIIDRIVSDKLQTRGSAFNNAARNYLGSKPPLRTR